MKFKGQGQGWWTGGTNSVSGAPTHTTFTSPGPWPLSCVKGSSGNVQDNTGLSHAEPASAPAPPLTVNGEHITPHHTTSNTLPQVLAKATRRWPPQEG
jgi:hypothetical protein